MPALFKFRIKPVVFAAGMALCCVNGSSIGAPRAGQQAVAARSQEMLKESAQENSQDSAQEATQHRKHIVKDLYYGDTLFEFFQEHYFKTLTDLMVSQYFERIAHHNDEAEILRGSILLSYGLHREAGEVFDRLIYIGATPVTRDRAWFYLAKIRYQRGYLAQAETALSHIGKALPQDLQEERILLQSNLLMARGDYKAARSALESLGETESDYVHYNLGIALIKSGDVAGGKLLLDKIGAAVQDDEEHRSLRDRANLALGFAALAGNQPAGKYFERVRLKSAQSSKALLGMGWSWAANKDYKQALIPWQELAQRDDNDTAELEARIAVPYAYAELGALAQSARLYTEAIAAFERENQNLSESIALISSGSLMNTLLDNNPGTDMGWFWSIGELPDMPHASHLAHVLAQNEFQEAFKNYRDLRFLTSNLEQWRDKLGVFEDMLANRRQAFAQRLPQVTEQAKVIGLDAMQVRFANAAHQIAQGEADADGVAFASAKQTQMLERAKSAGQMVTRHPDDAEFKAAHERVRLAQGTLIWQLAQDYPARVWQAQKDLHEIDSQLKTAQQLEADLRQAQSDEPARFDQFGHRIAELSARLNATLPRIAELTLEQQQVVQNIAIAQLSHEREMLGHYSTQARFALAQMYDRGTGRTSSTQEQPVKADQAGQQVQPEQPEQKEAAHAP